MSSMEQTLIEDLIIESIKIYGIDGWYIIRNQQTNDNAFNENTLSVFDRTYMLEMYVKNVDSFEGEGDFLSKFGLQIRDSITLTIAVRRFNDEIGLQEQMPRPREGDLIFLPLNRKIFEIRHVEHEAIFYQMGSLQTYDLKCDLFEYSNEQFMTNNIEIDSLLDRYEIETDTTMEQLENIEPLADNNFFEQEAADILDFSEKNPYGSDTY